MEAVLCCRSIWQTRHRCCVSLAVFVFVVSVFICLYRFSRCNRELRMCCSCQRRWAQRAAGCSWTFPLWPQAWSFHVLSVVSTNHLCRWLIVAPAWPSCHWLAECKRSTFLPILTASYTVHMYASTRRGPSPDVVSPVPTIGRRYLEQWNYLTTPAPGQHQDTGGEFPSWHP